MGYAVSPQFTVDPNQSLPLDKQLSFTAYGCFISNLTNQWFYLDGANEYVPPYTSGRAIPLQGQQKISGKFTAPTSFTNPTSIAGQLVYVRCTEQPILPAPGLPVSPISTRWEIDHQPGTGVLASVTKAAAPGVIHTADYFHFSFLQNNAAPVVAIVSTYLRDGASGVGAIIWATHLGVPATNGAHDDVTAGPLLGQKGTIGNAMTVEFSAAAATMIEDTVLIGYDQ